MTRLPVDVQIRAPSTRYLDELCRLKCASELLDPRMKLFPNAKEITESFAAFRAVRLHLRDLFPLDDEAVTLVAVGDGCRPRTGATFAYRTRWRCVSVDPLLRTPSKYAGIQRLSCEVRRVEELSQWYLDAAVIVAVHSHASLPATLRSIGATRRAVVAIPCCVRQELKRDPDIEYKDYGIFSPHRTVKIWRDV
jgi:hypothetical protein